MAERRMFAKTVIESDRFADLPLRAQALYFHLGLRADDDGFLQNVKQIERLTGTEETELEALVEAGFVLRFESGAVVLRHWRQHNYIRKDAYTGTKCKKEMAELALDGNKCYVLKAEAPDGESFFCPTLSTQVREGKDRVDKDRVGEDRIGKDRVGEDREEQVSVGEGEDSVQKHPHGEYNNVMLTKEEYEKLQAEFADFAGRIQRLSDYMASKGVTYQNHYATIRAWAREDAKKAEERDREAAPSSFDAEDFFSAALANTYKNQGGTDFEHRT